MKRCTRTDCCRAGSDLGNCGEFALPCPPPVTVEPGKDIVIRCQKCGITRAIPVASVMQGISTMPRCQGEVSVCQAILVVEPQVKSKK